jgi:hypothetical protein
MTLIDDLSELLPIDYPFELKKAAKDDINLRVIILLSVSEGATPPIAVFIATTNVNGNILNYFNTVVLLSTKYPFIRTEQPAG